MMNINIDDIVYFISRYTFYMDKEALKKSIEDHLRYKTCFVILDPLNEICAYCDWNIDKNEAHIINCIIREDYRKSGLLERIVFRGLSLWGVNAIRFTRRYSPKNIDRPLHRWNSNRLLRRTKWAAEQR